MRRALQAVTLPRWLRRARDGVLAPGSRRRRAYDHAVALLRGGPAGAPLPPEAQYQAWLRRQRRPRQLRALRAEAARFAHRPLVSIVTPVYDVDEAWLRRCIASVQAQAYSRWELCLVDDGSTRPHVPAVLAEHAAQDPRIRTARHAENRGIIAASATALAMARGELVAFLDHDDELSPDALLEVVRVLQDGGDVDLIYSDEDKIDGQGQRVEPFFKPDWSPDLLLSMNYVCHLTVVRRALLEEVGGIRPGYEGSQDYDLLLRVTERARRIVHVPQVLYHWRKIPGSAAAEQNAKPYAFDAARRALTDAVRRRGIDASISMPFPGTYHVAYAVPDPPHVSIVIPTRDGVDLLRTCIESIQQKTTYSSYELLVVDNGSSDPATLEYFAEVREKHRVLPYPRPFNWSAINNFAVPHARGSVLLFMNNDMEVISPGWLEALVAHVQRPEVGVVGAKLLYPDGRLQHAGVVLGLGGIAGHGFRLLPGDARAYFHFPQVVRDVSAVTGACMMVRREVFDRLGGFDEQLRVAFNDIDFCLRASEAGHRIVYTPHAVLYHHESATRGPGHPPEEEAVMNRRWGQHLAEDPFYSPHLSLVSPGYQVKI
jgi:GT2 family glycosyltransferase